MRHISSYDIFRAYAAVYDFGKLSWMMRTGRLENDYEVIQMFRCGNLQEFSLSCWIAGPLDSPETKTEYKQIIRKTTWGIIKKINQIVESSPAGKHWVSWE